MFNATHLDVSHAAHIALIIESLLNASQHYIVDGCNWLPQLPLFDHQIF